jgi:HEAT repeat protein
VLLGAGFSLLYLITNVHLFFEYRKALASGLKEGTLDLGDNPLERAKLPAETLESLIMELAPLEDESSLCVFGSALKLLDRKRRGLLYGPLLERGGERAKIMILEAIARDESWDQAPGIRRLASEGGRPLRCAALGVLAAVGDGETLARGLEDQDPGVRVEAASLVLSRPGLGHGVRAREVIDDALESGSEESRACALSALGRVVSPESVRILLEQYALQGGSARNAALDSLGSLCAAMSLEPDLRAQVEAAVTKAMDEADDAARSIALNAAIRMNIPGLPPACFSRLDDPSPAVRNFAREFLVLRESQFIELASRNVQSLYGMKLEGVLSILGRIGTSPCRDILYRFMESRVAQCAEAMQGLVLLEGNGRTERGEIYAEVLRDFVSRTTQHLLSALEGAEEPGLVRAVRLGLFSWEDHRKAHALETLSGMGRRSVTSLLVPLLEDMSWEERLKAFRSIQGIQLKNIDDLAESHAASSDLLLRTGALLYRGALPNLDEEVLKMKNLILLRRVPVFEKMALEDLLAVSASLQESLYYGGEVIFREKDPGDEMFIIVEGTVRIFKNHGRPGALELAVLGSNSYFGEMALLSEEPRSATAVASEDTKLLSLRGESLREIIVQRPEIAFQLIKVLIGRLLRSEERTLR